MRERMHAGIGPQPDDVWMLRAELQAAKAKVAEQARQLADLEQDRDRAVRERDELRAELVRRQEAAKAERRALDQTQAVLNSTTDQLEKWKRSHQKLEARLAEIAAPRRPVIPPPGQPGTAIEQEADRKVRFSALMREFDNAEIRAPEVQHVLGACLRGEMVSPEAAMRVAGYASRLAARVVELRRGLRRHHRRDPFRCTSCGTIHLEA